MDKIYHTEEVEGLRSWAKEVEEEKYQMQKEINDLLEKLQLGERSLKEQHEMSRAKAAQLQARNEAFAVKRNKLKSMNSTIDGKNHHQNPP